MNANSRAWHIALIVLATVFSAACGASRPIHYYALDVPSESPQPASSPFPVTLLVARVGAAHLYRDDRIVYGTNGLQLGTYEYERWSEPPTDMVQDSLISALRATKQYRSVSAVASNLRGEYLLRSRLEALDEMDKPQVAARFAIQVELYDMKAGAIVWSDSYTHDEPVSGKKVPQVVEALDANVKAGMTQVANNLGQYFASHRP